VKENCINIDTNKLLSELKKISSKEFYQVELTGGEPLTHPDFFNILHFFLENSKYVSVITNGMLINNGFINRLKEFDKNIRKKIVFSISLDAPNKNLYKIIRGVDGFDTVKYSIMLLRQNGFFVRSTMTIIPSININYLYKTFKFATKELDVNLFGYTPMMPLGRAQNEWDVTNAVKFYDKMKKQEDLIKKDLLSKRLETSKKSNSSEKTSCGVGYKKCAISYKGNIKPCILFPEDFLNLGNIFNDNIEDIFDYSNLNDLINSEIVPCREICSDCNHYNRFKQFCEGCFLNGLVIHNSYKKCIWFNKLPTSLSNRMDFKYCYKV